MDASLNIPATAAIVARATALFEDLSFTAAREWKAAARRPQGRRLHADLRAARDRSRRQHAAARRPRRRRSARGHPRRRLLPELHLPHSALDHRARRIGPARLRRWHAVPLDLRCDPQSVGHVEDDVSATSTSATSTCRRITATTSAAIITSTSLPSSAHDLGELRGAPITDAELSRSIALYNENRRLVRELYALRAERPWQTPAAEVYLVLRAGMVLPVEEHSAMIRDYLAAAARRGAGQARQLPHRADRRLLRAAAAQSHQVARAVRLLRGRRRSVAGHPLADRRRADRGRSAEEIWRWPSCIIPNRRRPSTNPT